MNSGPQNLKVKNMSICHVNIRGLSASKLRSVQVSLSELYDVITISETFVSASSTHNLDLPGFHPIIRRDRSTFGGGVAVYVRSCIPFKRKCQFESKGSEIIWIELNTLEGKIQLCTAYRPPNDTDF